MSNSATTQSSTVLLNRLLSLKETSPLLLIQDSIAQSSYFLIQEFIHNIPKESTNIIYVSFETVIKPKFVTVESNFIEAWDKPFSKLVELIHSTLETNVKNLILIDSINDIPTEKLSSFITSLIRPNVTVLTTFHSSLPEQQVANNSTYPSNYKILSFIASSIFEIIPTDDEEVETQLNGLKIPKGLNNGIFTLNLINRRKSGRSISYKFQINSINHEYRQLLDNVNSTSVEDESLLKGLTTFNLTTTQKQKIAKEGVELPFLDAQNFETGGAIVYEFEKDDDYDEEDPYEDPF